MAKGFRIAARALRQLGAELITSDDVALNELIKNAFDARSPRVKVEIHASVDAHVLDLIAEKLESEQMDPPRALERLVKAISTELPAASRNDIIQAATEAAGRSRRKLLAYIGELRTGQRIEVSDTGVGMSADDLANRFLVIGTPGKFLERRDAAVGSEPILGDKGIGRLSMMRIGNTATIRSTQAGALRWHEIAFAWQDFEDPDLFLDDVEVEVRRGERKSNPDVRGTTIVLQELFANWNGDKVSAFIQKYMRRLQDPFLVSRRPYPVDVVLNGVRQSIPGLPPWLAECAQFRASITFDPKGIDGTNQVFRRDIKWRTGSSAEQRSWTLTELTGELDVPAAIFESLGSFSAECLWFNRSALTVSDVDRNRTEIAEELNSWCGGFAVYRDNFRVGKTGGMDDDWLEWDSGALRAKGFALNRYQTVGSVRITSRGNRRLVDSANRERLVACPEQELLKRLLGEVLVKDLRMHINAVREAEAKIMIAEESGAESIKVAEEGLARTVRAVGEIKRLLPAAEKHRIDDVQEALHGQIEYIKTVKKALALAQEKKIEVLELANIGLVVEIVIHELSRLTERTAELLAELQRGDNKKSIVEVVDNLRVQIVATNKRIRTVDHMSPSGRHRKENYDAVAQTKAIVSGFKARFKRHQIVCDISLDEGEPNRPLNVYMVRGLIAQVLENLLTNSVYWLQQGLKQGESERRITISIDSASLTVSVADNGPGIDPKYANEIFKPYYTTRRKGKGLGLYIASELVGYHEGQLYLEKSPEEDGRLRTFVLELPREGN